MVDASDKFSLYLAGIIAPTLLAIVALIMINEAAMDSKVAELIKAGIPPTEALCAIRPSYSGCVVRFSGDRDE